MQILQIPFNKFNESLNPLKEREKKRKKNFRTLNCISIFYAYKMSR